MTNAVATVAFIQGQAWAKAADGTMRPLSLGAVLNEGEILITAQGARVELEFGQGDTIAINGGQEVAMSRDLNLQTATTEDEAKLDDGSVQQAMTVLNQGGDLLDNLEETAAGSSGGGSSGNEGHDFVQLARVLEQTDAQSFQFSTAEQPTLNQPEDTGQNLLANQAPDVGDQNLSVDEDQVLFGRVDASDLEGEPLTYGINAAPLHGTLELNTATGQFVYTPNTDYNGADSFSVTVTDDHGNTSIGQVSVGVNPVNDAPATRDLDLTTNEDTPISGQVVAGDVDGDSLSYTLTTNPANGSLVLNPNTGAFTYTPNANYNGSDSFVITVSDGQGGTTTSTVAVGVAPVNDAPVTSDQNISTQEDTPVTGNIVATDVDGDSLSYSLSTTPSHGTLVLNPATGAYTYTPSLNYNGSDSFVVTVSDGQGGTTTSTVVIGVTPANDAPTSSDQNFSTNEDTAVAGQVVAADLDGDTLSYSISHQPTHGNLAFSQSTGKFTYTPGANYNGSDSFVVTISDGKGGTTTSTINIAVNPVNDAPLSADQNLTTDEDVAKTGTVVATDIDGDSLSYSVSGAASHGNVVLDTTTGEFTYTPDANYNGSDSFVVTISDGKGGTTTSTINIAVNPVNDAPVSADQNLTTDEDVAKSGTVVASDIDGDSLSYAVSTAASHGSVALNTATGEFIYTPTTSYNGPDSFVVTINDGKGGTTTSTINISVGPVNDAPVSVADSISVNEGGTATVLIGGATSVLANDSDSESDPLSAILVTGPAHGALTLNTDGTFSYTHDGSETTSDSFSYRANDGTENGNVVTVNIAVTPENDAPVAVNDSSSVNEGDSVVINLATNDTDADNTLDLSSIQIVSGPANGSITVNADGTVSYQHNGSETTADSFSYTIKDASGATSNVATVNLTVNPVNDAPVAVADNISVSEGGTATVLVGGASSVLTNDSDAESDPLSAILVTGPAHGTLTLNADGTFSYTHDGSETTSDSFSYRANDGTENGNVVTVNIVVTPENDAPVAVNDSSSVNEGDSVVINLANNDTDADNALDLTSIQIISGPANGSITVNADGTVSYQHNGSETTVDSFTYTIKDASGATSNVATVNLTVNPVNDAPVAVADSISVSEGGTATVLVGGASSVLTNDSDAESDPLSAILVTGPAHGTLTLNADGTFSYTHDGSETTSDSFSYRANDGTENGNVVTVNIAVTPENDAPVAVDDSSSVNEGDSVVINLAGNDTDADNTLDLSSIQIVSGPANGSITVNADGTVSYQHNGSETTADSFTYTIKDASGAVSNVATVNLTVNPVNDAPVSVADSISVSEGGTATVLVGGASSVLTNDSDAESDPLSAILVSGPAHGTLTLNTDGTFSYTHDGSETTSDSFSYRANDGTVNGNVVTVNIAVTPVNDAPVAVDDSSSVNEGDAVVINLAGNDTDVDNALDLTSIQIVSGPANGSITVNADGTVSYQHNGSETTSDSFTYTIKDASGATSNVATVNLTVNPVNDAPVAVNDSSSVNEGDAVVINLASNDTDADNALDLTSIQIVSGPANGSITVNADGTVSYQHNGSETTSDSFSYTIKDASGAVSNVATVNLSVNPVNDAPVAVADNISVSEGGTATVLVGGASSVLTNDSDAESDPLSAILVSGPAHGTLTLNTDGTFSYTHDGSETTSDSFSYRANDGTENGNVVTVNIAVAPVNDAPVAVDDSSSVNEGDSVVINLATNDTDADNALDLTSIQIVSGPANGSITVNADGTVSYQHNGSETTADSFTYTIKDASGATSNVATVNLTVNPVNDAPVAVADNISVSEGGTATVLVGGASSVLTNDSDADSDPLSAILVTGPAHGTLTLNTDGTFSYTHDGSETTSDSFSYRANDGTENGNVVTVNIVVTPENDVPVAVDDSSSVNEGDFVVINLAGNDTDVDNTLDLTSIQIISGPANGSITVNADGTVSYQHNGSETTSDSFTYTIKDASGAASNVATVNLTVNPVNDAPVAVNDSSSVNEGDSVVINLAGNDTDADNTLDLTSIQIVSGPANGSITVNADGTVSYQHNGSETTSDSFTYTIKDASGAASNVATVNLTVNPVNDAPVAVADNISVNEGGTATVLVGGASSVLTNDSDAESDPLSAILVSGPAHGTLTLNTDGTFSYTHDGNETTSDSFTYRANDGTENGNVVTVNIAVTPENDAPVAVNDPSNANYSINLGATATDYWTNLSDKGVSIVYYRANGTVGYGYERPADHALGVLGSPRTDTPTVTYQIEYDQTSGTSESIGMTFSKGLLNHAVFGVSNLFPGEDGGEIGFWQAYYNGVVVASDTFRLAGTSDKGEFTIDTGDIVFDSVRFYALNTNNGTGDGGDYHVTYFQGTGITSTTGSYLVSEGGTLTIDSSSSNRLTSNDTDADSDSLTVSKINGVAITDGQSITLASGATLVIHTDGSFSYSANSAFNSLDQGKLATDSFTYTIADGHGGTSTATASVSVVGTGAALSTVGTSGNDTIVGTAGADLMIGGAGNDTLSGSVGADTFKWSLGDQGSAGTPAVDTITGFSKSQGDMLDISDLLQGENSSNLTDYLHFTYDSTSKATTLHISSGGGYSGGYTSSSTDQQIVLNGINLVNSSSDSDIITQLKAAGYLITN